MLDNSQLEARILIIKQIGKLVDKFGIKVVKEKNFQNNVYVTYKGERYYSMQELKDAYESDCFTSNTYDRLMDKYEKAQGNKNDALTATESILKELIHIKNNFEDELNVEEFERIGKLEQEQRIERLVGEGYSYKEINDILDKNPGNINTLI